MLAVGRESPFTVHVSWFWRRDHRRVFRPVFRPLVLGASRKVGLACGAFCPVHCFGLPLLGTRLARR
jgi:hypothetical protein